MDFNKVACSIFDKACAVVGTKKLLLPRVVRKLVHRDNVEAESALQYYQRSIFLPNVNGLSSFLRERFNDSPSFFTLFSILPPSNPTNITNIKSLHSLDNLVNEVKL